MDRRDAWCLTALLGIATLVFADVLLGVRAFYHPDLLLYHYPMKLIVRNAMSGMEFPFWNRFYSGGQPLAANPAYELFYPLQWLILLGPYRFGFALHIVAHIYVALAGTYLLLREMSLGRPASFFGSFSLGMGGLIIGCITVLPTLFVWALAPLVGWAVLRFLHEASWSRLSVAILCAGVQLLIGEPVAILQVWILLLAGSVMVAGIPRALRTLLLVGAGACLVATVQLIPAADHVRDSIRSVGFTFESVDSFAMPPTRPVELLIPRWFGRYQPVENTFWGGSAFARHNPYLPSLYNGIAVAILALAGLLLHARGSLAVLFITSLSYLLAIGDRTPLLRILYDLGIARGFRFPEKFAAMGVVTLTIFAATIADRLLTGDRPARRMSMMVAAVVCSAAATPFLWSLTPGWQQQFIAWWHLSATDLPLTDMARTGFLLGLVACMSVFLLLVLLPRMNRRTWLMLAFAAMLFDGTFAIGLAARSSPRFYTAPDVVRSLERDQQNYSIFHRGEWKKGDDDYRALRHLLGPWFARDSLAPFSLARWGYRTTMEVDFDETDLLPTHVLLASVLRLRSSGYPAWAESLGAITNVRYLADYRTVPDVVRAPDPEHARVVRFTRIPNTGPYYFAQQATNEEPLTFMIRNGIRRPTAFVEGPMKVSGSGRVLHVDEHANSATIEVLCDSSALLVATVTRHKYWTATIDGRPAALIPVNIAFQGLVVPAGRHVIEMRYRNPLVLGSLAVSSIATALCLVTIGASLVRRFRSADEGRSS